MLGNQDKVHDELTDFGVRVTDKSFTVIVMKENLLMMMKNFLMKSRSVVDSMLIYHHELCISYSSP